MPRQARRGGGRQVELGVTALGGRGDGLAEHEGRPVFLPFTLPGDRVRARLTGTRAGGFTAEVIELLAEGPSRVAPPCPHFGPCGGCALQHMAEDAYLAWKQSLVPQALARRGLGEVPVRPLLRVPPRSRRRAAFAARRIASGVVLGYHGRESHDIVDLTDCLLLIPALVALLAPLRAVLAEILVPGARAAAEAVETETGIDLLLRGGQPPALAAREALAAFAESVDLARLSWAGLATAAEDDGVPEPIVQRRLPRVAFGGVAVTPPPGGFLQPTLAGEAALRERLLAWLPAETARVVELYAGCGSFTFPLAAHAKVHAVEGDTLALVALQDGLRQAGLSGRITAERRDLDRAPLGPAELAAVDCVVFDPPRAGAREQAAEIARSDVPCVIALSCNPHSFARDARLLVDGGYRLHEVVPVDQFPWSGHLELIARFMR